MNTLKATVDGDGGTLEFSRNMDTSNIVLSIQGKNSQCLTLEVSAANLLHAVKSMIPDLNITVT